MTAVPRGGSLPRASVSQVNAFLPLFLSVPSLYQYTIIDNLVSGPQFFLIRWVRSVSTRLTRSVPMVFKKLRYSQITTDQNCQDCKIENNCNSAVWAWATSGPQPHDTGLHAMLKPTPNVMNSPFYHKWSRHIGRSHAVLQKDFLFISNVGYPLRKDKTFLWSSCQNSYWPPPHNQIYSRNWYAFSILKLTKFPPQYGGGFTFYYTKHFLNRIIPHV